MVMQAANAVLDHWRTLSKPPNYAEDGDGYLRHLADMVVSTIEVMECNGIDPNDDDAIDAVIEEVAWTSDLQRRDGDG